MKKKWKDTIITEVVFALYVEPGTGKSVHKNRAYHGFVINDADSIKDYVFDDGRVMKTEGNQLFYLPKGSSYRVVVHREGGCYAINFNADITDEPFAVSFRNADSLIHSFKAVCDAWKKQDDLCGACTMRALYDAIYQAGREIKKQYVSGEQYSVISPAVKAIEDGFTREDISVSSLAALCGISEVYFRRLFLAAFGVSPKEYIIQKRIEYAKSLLMSGDFSVSEVAIITGYSEPCHFSRQFSKCVGISPKQYKNL